MFFSDKDLRQVYWMQMSFQGRMSCSASITYGLNIRCHSSLLLRAYIIYRSDSDVKDLMDEYWETRSFLKGLRELDNSLNFLCCIKIAVHWVPFIFHCGDQYSTPFNAEEV